MRAGSTVCGAAVFTGAGARAGPALRATRAEDLEVPLLGRFVTVVKPTLGTKMSSTRAAKAAAEALDFL